MNKNINSGRFYKFLRICFAIILLGIGMYIYAHEVEPRLLQIKRITIEHPQVPLGFDGIRIVQFGDTHIGFHYDIKHFSKLIEQINQLHPDIIIFSGDLMDAPNQFNGYKQIAELLAKLDAPLGKFSVFGNHDHGGYGTEIFQAIMKQAKFILLRNESFSIKLIDGSYIRVIGLDDAMLGKPDLEEALTGVAENEFTLLLSHAPDYAQQAVQFAIDLQLSGHSHGGQMKLPFIGTLITPPFAEQFKEGLYHVDASEGNHSLLVYVNRGIGTTRLPYRFFAKPEITVLTLKKQ